MEYNIQHTTTYYVLVCWCVGAYVGEVEWKAEVMWTRCILIYILCCIYIRCTLKMQSVRGEVHTEALYITSVPRHRKL
jgi:hypothetical protein